MTMMTVILRYPINDIKQKQDTQNTKKKKILKEMLDKK